MNNTVKINDVEYSIRSMNAKQQWHVARRLAPVLTAAFAGAAKMEAEDVNLFAAMGPLAERLASMTDADSDYVFDACLGVCQRQQETGWANVMGNGQLMFKDMNMDVMLTLVMEVVKVDIIPFFPKDRLASLLGA